MANKLTTVRVFAFLQIVWSTLPLTRQRLTFAISMPNSLCPHHCLAFTICRKQSTHKQIWGRLLKRQSPTGSQVINSVGEQGVNLLVLPSKSPTTSSLTPKELSKKSQQVSRLKLKTYWEKETATGGTAFSIAKLCVCVCSNSSSPTLRLLLACFLSCCYEVVSLEIRTITPTVGKSTGLLTGVSSKQLINWSC